MVVVEKEGETPFYIEAKLKRNLDNIKKKINTKDRDYVLIIDGEEGCFSEDTLIQTSEGNKSIKEFVDKNKFVVNTLGLNLNKGKKEVNKSKIIPSGKKEVYEIETVDGRKVQATLEHTFFVENNGVVKEVMLKDLKVGDNLICEKG